MKKQYCHLQATDRKAIYFLLRQDFSIIEITNRLGCHKTTIYPELQRNSDQLDYRPVVAEQSYQFRKQKKPSKLVDPEEFLSN